MKIKLFAAFVALSIFLFSFTCAMAQNDVVGFWGVTEVMVGDEIMTPIAKWMKINKDQTFQNGNGWQQNSVGTWTYDKKKRTYLARETRGIGLEEEANPFLVSFKDNQMIWEREEEGEKVKVTLKKITEMPLAPANYLTGLWDLTSISKNGEAQTASFDPQGKHYIFIRWDRTFMERTPQGERAAGLWHINGHKPEVTFIPHDKNRPTESWRVSFQDKELRMLGISETNKDVEMVYSSIGKFPE